MKSSKKQPAEDAADAPLLTYSQHGGLYEQAKRRGGLNDAVRNDPTDWLQLVPTELATGPLLPSETSHSPQDTPSQHAVGRKTTPQRKTATSETAREKVTRLPPKPVSSSSLYDADSCRYSVVPTYNLQDRSSGVEGSAGAASRASDWRGLAARKRSPTPPPPSTKAKTSAGDRSQPSAQRQIKPRAAPPAARKPNQQHSASRLSATKPPTAASTLSAARNKSTEWNVAAAVRPKQAAATKTGAAVDASAARRRQLVRPSQTTSATATGCSTAATLPSLRLASSQLQRKIHGPKTSERPATKKAQTYDVKKPPLPYKVGAAAVGLDRQ